MGTENQNNLTLGDLHHLLVSLNTKIDKQQETLLDIKSEVSGLTNKVAQLEGENVKLKKQIRSLDHQMRKNIEDLTAQPDLLQSLIGEVRKAKNPSTIYGPQYTKRITRAAKLN
ncbi:hypothetical protein JTB14_000835 [Gonioctena quinquepunctata]|nr:hypothetical protein JTB14_000835 [Gonioctena quinquepunctata]